MCKLPGSNSDNSNALEKRKKRKRELTLQRSILFHSSKSLHCYKKDSKWTELNSSWKVSLFPPCSCSNGHMTKFLSQMARSRNLTTSYLSQNIYHCTEKKYSKVKNGHDLCQLHSVNTEKRRQKLLSTPKNNAQPEDDKKIYALENCQWPSSLPKNNGLSVCAVKCCYTVICQQPKNETKQNYLNTPWKRIRI